VTPLRGRVTIRHPDGLHARPAVKLTRLAKSFPAEIRLRGAEGGAWVNAKSIVRVMDLKLPTGTVLEIEVSGPRAASVLDALTGLVERDFDDRS